MNSNSADKETITQRYLHNKHKTVNAVKNLDIENKYFNEQVEA